MHDYLYELCFQWDIATFIYIYVILYYYYIIPSISKSLKIFPPISYTTDILLEPLKSNGDWNKMMKKKISFYRYHIKLILVSFFFLPPYLYASPWTFKPHFLTKTMLLSHKCLKKSLEVYSKYLVLNEPIYYIWKKQRPLTYCVQLFHTKSS